jgi:hypothetical protein
MGAVRDADVIHAAMGDVQSSHFGGHGPELHLDEPFQHYQFAGRADLVAIDRARRALLHVENRTRFPDIQGFAGSFNSKRAYLGEELAARYRIAGGFVSETHVIAALWSSEVLHTLRLRTASFRAIAPDPPDAFAAWWEGRPPPTGISTTFVLFDPLPGKRVTRRRYLGLEDALGTEPRYRDYRNAVEVLRANGMA